MKTKRTDRRSTSSRDILPPALLGAALRSQSEGVFIADASMGADGLRILFANESFAAITGHPTRDLVGRGHAPFHIEKSDRERLEHWLPKARCGQSLTGEGYLLRADGSTVYAAWTFDPICNTRGRITHIVATYRDTTEKRRLQEALVHSQRLDALGRLAGGVAHDFNNLISVINGYCQILAGRLSGHPDALREVEEIHMAGQKAAALTRHLLAFGRRQAMDPRVINLNHVVQGNTSILQRILGNTGKLVLELAPDLENTRADPDQFQQVLLNLVINARDALRDHGEVVIRTANRVVNPGLNRRATDTPPGRYAALTISDNGMGMDAHTQAHLFEPFFTTKEEGKGTGLGLALVYGIVQQSGGFISVHSALLVGSTFEILLPAVSEPAEALPSASVPALPATRGHESVLLVEEDIVLSKMLAGILTADGYRVTTAANPTLALKEARQLDKPPQLLITSLTAAATDSDKLVRALHAMNPELRILNTGSAGTDVNPVASLAAERCFDLPKPFALSELLKTARQLLDL